MTIAFLLASLLDLWFVKLVSSRPYVLALNVHGGLTKTTLNGVIVDVVVVHPLVCVPIMWVSTFGL